MYSGAYKNAAQVSGAFSPWRDAARVIWLHRTLVHVRDATLRNDTQAWRVHQRSGMEKPLISATEFLRRLESVSASVRELETIARAKYLTDSHAANEAHAPERLRDRAMLHIARVGDATITELVNELDSNTTSVRRALFELFDQDRVALVMEKHEHTRRWRAYCPHRVVVTARGRASDISELGGNLQDWAAGDD